MGYRTHRLSDADFLRLQEVLNTSKSVRSIHFYALCALILGSGARVGEAISTRVCDLFAPDWSPLPTYTRKNEKRHTATNSRITSAFPWDSLGSPILDWLAYARKRGLILTGKDFLFSLRFDNSHISRRTALHGVGVVLSSAGIASRGVGTHGLRKTYLSTVFRALRKKDIDLLTAARYVQKLAGHARLETTIIYLEDEFSENPAQTFEAALDEMRRNSNR